MRKIFFGLISILIIAGLGWYFFWQKQIPATAPGEQTSGISEKGWVEVVNKGVFLVNADGTVGNELKNGDEVTGGQTLMTDETGLANLHFSDGSVARLETQTKVELKDFAYFSDSQTLKVKIFLQTGRVWSRIKALMTTGSYWEVETSNAVAAVRGTSFGVVYVPGQTTVIGSVHLININAIDPQAKKLIENNTAYVGAEQYIKINDQDIAGLLSGVKLTSKVKPYNQVIINDAWVVKSKAQDEELEGQTADYVVSTSSTKDETVVKPVEKPTEEIVETPDSSIIQRDGGSSAVITPEDITETQVQPDGQTSNTVEEDFYRSVDSSSETESFDSMDAVDPTGAAPNETTTSDQTTTTTQTTVSPTYTTNLNTKLNTIAPQTTTTTTTTTTKLPLTNFVR